MWEEDGEVHGGLAGWPLSSVPEHQTHLVRLRKAQSTELQLPNKVSMQVVVAHAAEGKCLWARCHCVRCSSNITDRPRSH